MKILVIDDEPTILRTVQKLLEYKGFTCHTCSNPMHGISAFRKENFDVIMTDIYMPEMDGMSLLETAKNIDRDIKVIVFTGYDDIETSNAAMNKGAYAFFAKPINFARLFDTLQLIQNEIELTS